MERATVQDILDRDLCVLEAVLSEPRVKPLLDRVARCRVENGQRWHMYEQFKQEVMPLVGGGAYCNGLRTERHYIALVNAIDALLPADVACNDDDAA